MAAGLVDTTPPRELCWGGERDTQEDELRQKWQELALVSALESRGLTVPTEV